MSLPPIESKYITEESLREWKNGNTEFKLPNPVPMLRFVYELFWSMIRGELPIQKCKAALDSVEFNDKASDEEASSVFADVVALMAQDLTVPGEYRARLVKVAKWLVDSALVPLRLFQERCEEEFLWESEMIKIKAQDLKAKEVRVNTRLLYQQTKFNLLREESEGYSKLVTLLCQSGREVATVNASGATISIIKSLIGHFDLDPNRVFDIVLECFELEADSNVFSDLIPIFPKSHAAHILGFKFQYYQRMEVNDPVPSGLYRLTAVLVKSDFIDLDSIYTHLLPKEEEAFEHYHVFSAKRFDEVNKIGKINLAATGKDLMDEEKPGDVTIDLYAALDLENEAVIERSPELVNNQGLGLLNGFLSVDDWFHAHMLFERLSPLNPVAHIQICEGLFRIIEKTISSPYATVRQTHLPSSRLPSVDALEAINTLSVQKSHDLPKELFQMLSCAGPYLYRDALLLQKVCRVLKVYYQSALELGGSSSGTKSLESVEGRSRDPRVLLREARLRVEEALGTCLLPSLQLIPANPAVGQEIWEVLSLLPYEARYRLYGEWEKDEEQIPMVLAARQTAKLDTRRILKRLAKENLKQLGRMVAKLAHANPMTVLRTIVHQIEAYRDMIAPVVDAFKYLTQLEYDILEYVVIERLAQGGREKLKDDGLNLSDWLQSLASFWGHLCKKYPSMELRGLFQYLVNQLKKGKGIELVLLQELIQQMANVQYTENMTEEQLDAMAGSESLRYQATAFGITRNNKALVKSTNRLRDSLVPKEEPKLAVPLLLLIAQHRSVIVISSDAPYIKMISEQFDRCHGTLLQYVEFLCSAVTPNTSYALLVPPLEDLVQKYHLDPEVAFLIYRPVMRLFKCSNSSNVFWPTGEIEETDTSEESEYSASSAKLVLDLGPPRKPIMWSNLLDTVRTMLPLKAWNSLSPDLYATFWGLTLYDLYVPRKRYNTEISKQHAALKALEELSDNSNVAITKRKKEKERIQELLDRLTSELEKHEENVASVRKRLAREKDKWLSFCPDHLKINMEFLQRCIFPRCIFSMPDAVYCAMFVHTLHSLGTPFFNTVNHIDVLICKTLQPMICCCTEYEAGRLGRFLFETLKMVYHWKSDESIYERECGNMPGFAVYYRYPNSQRVSYSQFIKVCFKWSGRITRLLIQCLESAEYMEIRNALILLTKISSVFPVTRKTGINLEKRVAKIKADEREDLKVLATGVAAALAARKGSWVTEEEFAMGYVDVKPAPPSSSRSVTVPVPNRSALNIAQHEVGGTRRVTSGTQLAESDSGNPVRDQLVQTRSVDGRPDRTEAAAHLNSNTDQSMLRAPSTANRSDVQLATTTSIVQSGVPWPIETQRHVDESTRGTSDEAAQRAARGTELEARSSIRRSVPTGILTKQPKQEISKDDNKAEKPVSRATSSFPSSSERDLLPHPSDSRQSGVVASTSNAAIVNGNAVPNSTKGSNSSARASGDSSLAKDIEPIKPSDSSVSLGKDIDGSVVSPVQRPSALRPARLLAPDDSFIASKSLDKQTRRSSPVEEHEKPSKRKKGDNELKDGEGEVRFIDRERSVDLRSSHSDHDKIGSDDQSHSRAIEKHADRSKDKGNDRYDRDHRERLERPDKSPGEDIPVEKSRDRSLERYGRERSVERLQDRGTDRSFNRVVDKSKVDRNKDDHSKPRYSEPSAEKSQLEDRFYRQSLPPPPPLPPNVVPQSVSASRRDEDTERRVGNTRHMQRLSPRHEEKERRRSEENSSMLQDDTKRRREDEFRERKRDERDGLAVKGEERNKGIILKADMDAGASKRRKLKRDNLPSGEAGEYTPPVPMPSPGALGMPQPYDGRDRGDRKGAILQRSGYMEEPVPRMHGKETTTKIPLRDNDPIYEREWEDEKRQRPEQKRKHRK